LDIDFGAISTRPSGAAALDEQMRERARRRYKEGSTDAKSLLRRARENEEKLRAMDPEAAAQARAAQQWEAAMKRAGGEKVHDDIKRLAKTVRRQEKGKEKSRDKWAERLAAKDEELKERVTKRSDNIEERRRAKAEKILRKRGIVPDAKPGRRPGFEGQGWGSRARVGFEGSGEHATLNASIMIAHAQRFPTI
jgi:Surfeit locus protein 6